MAVDRRRHAPRPRVGENTKPPRYRLLAAAAALPQRKPALPSESFERDCPACGRSVLFTQVPSADGIEYTIEDHDCADDPGAESAT